MKVLMNRMASTQEFYLISGKFYSIYLILLEMFSFVVVAAATPVVVRDKISTELVEGTRN